MYGGHIHGGVSKTPAVSETEFFVASIKSFQRLSDIAGSSILDFAGGLDAHLMYMSIFIHIKTMCPPVITTIALSQLMYLSKKPMNQRVLNKLSKKLNISGHK